MEETAASPASMQPFVLLSFGGGVNSTALLVGLEEREERPDAILFADTGGEKPGTYQHIERMQTWLASKKFPPITVVKQKLTLEQDCLDRETLPGKAFGFGSCSDRFKIQPQKKWLKDNDIKNPMWLVGIHSGEKQRRWSWESLVKADESQLRLPLFDDVQAPICDQCVDW